MYLVRCEGVTYFIEKDRDTIQDFIGMADDIYICKNETSAIRRHLLESLGMMYEEEEE